MYPTSVLLRKGHRIRVALAGGDVSLFERYPAEGKLGLVRGHREAISCDFRHRTAGFLCNSDCLAERGGFRTLGTSSKHAAKTRCVSDVLGFHPRL
jgi:hypothetical protein